MDQQLSKIKPGVPTEIGVTRFATARAQELLGLSKWIENHRSTKLIFQKLPCHMRRRAMSHNPKRMPRALREAHKAQLLKSGPIKQPKRPRRKYRRRPSRLLEEYKKRSSKSTWLETHVWHAKRFHMTHKWGHHLAERSCARSHRFCYRSVTQHTILLDISYLTCIELQGPQDAIINGLSSLCDAKVGPTFASVAYLKGEREGKVMLFEQNNRVPIGCVTYLWRFGDDPEQRNLWIWSHPAFYSLLLSKLHSIFTSNVENTKVQLVENKGKLNRFRLRGPSSHRVVSELLKDEDCGMLGDSLSPSTALGAEVRDPRMLLAALRAQRVRRSTREEAVSTASVSSKSNVWDAALREKVHAARQVLSDSVINKRREGLLVPGSILPPQPEELPIPILIINAPNEGRRYIPGCDIVLPEGWATAFWHALVYCGGHPGGLKDAARMNYEHGICSDLSLEVDSPAGRAEAKLKADTLMEEYFKKPPKVRTNYIKLATPCPFGPDWKQLLRCWATEGDAEFVVLRDRRLLVQLASKKKPSADSLTPYANHLLRVSLRVKHGCPHDNAMICLPQPEDKETDTIEEPVHKDPNASERKLLRKQHKAELRTLARKRKEDRKKDKTTDSSSEEAVKSYKEKIRSLWLPVSDDLRKYKRPIIGFVTSGDFALSEGKGIGQGFIALSAFLTIPKRMVLVRNPGTTNYMWADLSIE